MPATHILLDTNSYLRLARTIRPLLGQSFGDAPYLLSVIPQLNEELGYSRLQHEFAWVNDDGLAAERQFFPQLSRANKRGCKQNLAFIRAYVQSDLPGPSEIDATYVAYALELNCLLVTDDQLMQQLARDFDVRLMSTLELLRLMLDAGHINRDLIDGLVNYWRYDNDLPANFSKDFKRLFGQGPAT